MAHMRNLPDMQSSPVFPPVAEAVLERVEEFRRQHGPESDHEVPAPLRMASSPSTSFKLAGWHQIHFHLVH